MNELHSLWQVFFYTCHHHVYLHMTDMRAKSYILLGYEVEYTESNK